jgi:hypothetical protein
MAFDDRSALGRERAQGWARAVTGRLGFLPMEETVEPRGLSSQGGTMGDEGDELDPAGHEALDVEDVKTLVEPIDKEIDQVDSVGPDGPCLPLLDRGRLRDESEDSHPDLGKRFLKRVALPAHTPCRRPPRSRRIPCSGSASAEIPVARLQDGQPYRPRRLGPEDPSAQIAYHRPGLL